FFGIPTPDYDGALRLPSRLHPFADSMHRFQHGRSTAVGIDRAVHPGIAMIACNYPFIRQLAAANPPDHVPDGTQLVVLPEVHLHLGRTRTDVVGEGQRTLPITRRVGSSQ